MRLDRGRLRRLASGPVAFRRGRRRPGFSADDAPSIPLFSTSGDFFAGGIRGEDEDVFARDRAACQNSPGFSVVFDLVFEGDDRTIEGNDITAIEFGLIGL
jgi:hypothetical protein